MGNTLDNNLISRQAALDCFTATKLKKFDFILYAREEIKNLPPVNPQPKWIPVSEGLPNIHNYSENYFVTLKRGGVHTAMFTECDGKHWWTYDDVEAWMPLPAPYEPQESEE